MSIAALVVLACTGAAGLLLTARGERLRSPWGAGVLTVLLCAAGVLAWLADGA